jgi:hypothetical protein
MISNCANPGCGKPLVYLREGRVFIFEVSAGNSDASGKRLRRLEHFWLCGACSQILTLTHDVEGVHIVSRPAIRDREEEEIEALAS